MSSNVRRIMSHRIRVAEPDGSVSEYPLSVATVRISGSGGWIALHIEPYTKEEEGIEFIDFPPLLVRV